MKINKTEKIISALLSFSTIKEAAKNLKMAESTLYNYLKDDEFKIKYSEANKISIKNFEIQHLQKDYGLLPNLISTLIRTIEREKVSN